MENEQYKLTVGLEVHAELATSTKMFCSCKNDPDEQRPNVNICPVCLAHPGTLPVPNKQAIKKIFEVGLAIGGEIQNVSEFDRKNYFYPDIPKGYQISQYKFPFVSGGILAGVDIERVHLEEDTAKSTHSTTHSLVDFNRAGVPLMELVTKPCIHEPEKVSEFARELQLLLQYIGAARANMEKGEMRVEANISVSKDDKLGTKVEVKNLNSIKSAQKAVEYEYKRQIEVLESGGDIVQETRGWDDQKFETFSQRKKESSHDYRYFPDPDLPKISISEDSDLHPNNLAESIPKTPITKRSEFATKYGIKDADIEFFVYDYLMSDLFEAAASGLDSKEEYQLLSNYIVTDVASLDDEQKKIDPNQLTDLVKLIRNGDLSSRGAKDLIPHFHLGGKAFDIAKEKGLLQVTDRAALESIVDKVVTENEKVANEYKAGKEASLQFLIGMCMKEAKGAGNPKVFKEILSTRLS